MTSQDNVLLGLMSNDVAWNQVHGKHSGGKVRIGCVLICLVTLAVHAQQPEPSSAVHSYVIQNQPMILHEFEQLLAIPNIASDTPNIEKNAALLLQMVE